MDDNSLIDHNRHLYREQIRIVANMGRDVLRWLFIMNGGAATAIITAGLLEPKGTYSLVEEVIWLLTGATVAVIASFLNWNREEEMAQYLRTYLANGNPTMGWRLKNSQRIIMLIGLVSLIFFLVAVYQAALKIG